MLRIRCEEHVCVHMFLGLLCILLFSCPLPAPSRPQSVQAGDYSMTSEQVSIYFLHITARPILLNSHSLTPGQNHSVALISWGIKSKPFSLSQETCLIRSLPVAPSLPRSASWQRGSDAKWHCVDSVSLATSAFSGSLIWGQLLSSSQSQACLL